jgi:plastocyanin
MRASAAAVALVAAVGGALLVPAMPLAEEAPAPPTAVLESASPSVEAGTALKLDSSKSTAGATPIAGHVWDLDGNGSFETDTGTEPTVEVTPTAPGPLTVRVRVVDEGGQNSDAKVDLTVTPPPKAVMQPAAVPSSPTSENGSNQGADGVKAVNSDGGKPAAADGGKPAAADEPAAADPPAAAAPSPAADPAAPATDAAPAKSALGPIHMSAAPALVPRRALAARARAQGRTQPVADVHAAASTGVTIKDFKFGPASSSVQVGDTITWTNQDIAPHTATASDGSFNTGTINKGKSGSHTFTKAGTFAYICSIHPSMHGTVVVAAASGGTGGGSGGSGAGTSATPSTSSGSDLPMTGFDLLAVVLLASLMTGSGAVLRRRLG